MQKLSKVATMQREMSRMDPHTPRTPYSEVVRERNAPKTIRYDDLTPDQRARFWKKRVKNNITKLEVKNRAKKEAFDNQVETDKKRKEVQAQRLKEIQMIRAKQAAYIKQRMEEDLAEEQRLQEEEARARSAAKYQEVEVQCPSPDPNLECDQDGPTNHTLISPVKELSHVQVQTEAVNIVNDQNDDNEDREDRGTRKAGVQKATPLLIYRAGTNVSPPISFRANNKSPQVTPRDLGPAGVCSERLSTIFNFRTMISEAKTLDYV